jgi:serine/threonine protein kinase
MSEFLGKTIEEYQLVEIISEDETTIVYKGFQPSTNRYVMVIALKPHLAGNAANVQRFLQAAQLATQIHHSNILPVYNSGQAEGITYQVAPYIEGGTLHNNLAWFQEINTMLVLIQQITAALEHLHTQGYVHGNLKSSNTYLDAQRNPLLSNIGVTAISGATPDAYASPEQAQGGIVDKRSDVYALGVLVYEILVGETPPPGMIASLRSKRPDLPEAIERVILKAMAQNPDQRFQSAAEFQTALQTAVQSPTQAEALPPAPAPAVSQNVQVSQPKGTNWTAIILGVLLVAVLCGGFAFFVLPNLGDNQETDVPPPTSEQPLPTQPAPPPEQPPEQSPPEQPPAQLPAEPPEEPSQPPDFELPEVCGSIGGVGGLALMSVLMARKRRNLP